MLIVLFDCKIPCLEQRFDDCFDGWNIWIGDAVTLKFNPVVIAHVSVNFNHGGWGRIDAVFPFIQIQLHLLVFAIVGSAFLMVWKGFVKTEVGPAKLIAKLAPSRLEK